MMRTAFRWLADRSLIGPALFVAMNGFWIIFRLFIAPPTIDWSAVKDHSTFERWFCQQWWATLPVTIVSAVGGLFLFSLVCHLARVIKHGWFDLHKGWINRSLGRREYCDEPYLVLPSGEEALGAASPAEVFHEIVHRLRAHLGCWQGWRAVEAELAARWNVPGWRHERRFELEHVIYDAYQPMLTAWIERRMKRRERPSDSFWTRHDWWWQHVVRQHVEGVLDDIVIEKVAAGQVEDDWQNWPGVVDNGTGDSDDQDQDYNQDQDCYDYTKRLNETWGDDQQWQSPPTPEPGTDWTSPSGGWQSAGPPPQQPAADDQGIALPTGLYYDDGTPVPPDTRMHYQTNTVWQSESDGFPCREFVRAALASYTKCREFYLRQDGRVISNWSFDSGYRSAPSGVAPAESDASEVQLLIGPLFEVRWSPDGRLVVTQHREMRHMIREGMPWEQGGMTVYVHGDRGLPAWVDEGNADGRWLVKRKDTPKVEKPYVLFRITIEL